MSRKPYGTPSTKETVPGAAIHSDICGPFSVQSIGGSSYFITFKGEATAFRTIYFLKHKSEALEAFKKFLTDFSQTEWRIKTLRTDNGREYVNQYFRKFLLEKGIKHELTPPYLPALNGLAERENRTLVEMARSALLLKDLPQNLWAEAINSAAHIMNRVPNRKNTKTTPYEQWFGEKPDISHLRVFGSTAFVHINGQLRTKLEPTSRRVIFVGYGQSTKLYRICDPKRRFIETVRDVQIIEKIPQELIFVNGWSGGHEATPRKGRTLVPQQEGEDYLESNQQEGTEESLEEESVRNQEKEEGDSSDYEDYPLNQVEEPEEEEEDFIPLNSNQVPISGTTKRRPGRPPGAKNKPKRPPPVLSFRLRNRNPNRVCSVFLDPINPKRLSSGKKRKNGKKPWKRKC
jgi:hypothetical protein